MLKKIILFLTLCFIVSLSMVGCKKLSYPVANSNVASNPEIQKLKKENPIPVWRQYPDMYSENCLSETEKVLHQFIDALDSLGNNPKDKDVMYCVEIVVKKLNKLDVKYEHFIETMEREQLVEFITRSVYITGSKIDGDVTEKWRVW